MNGFRFSLVIHFFAPSIQMKLLVNPMLPFCDSPVEHVLLRNLNLFFLLLGLVNAPKTISCIENTFYINWKVFFVVVFALW